MELWGVRDELSLAQNGFILRRHRLVILASLQQLVTTLAHGENIEEHPLHYGALCCREQGETPSPPIPAGSHLDITLSRLKRDNEKQMTRDSGTPSPRISESTSEPSAPRSQEEDQFESEAEQRRLWTQRYNLRPSRPPSQRLKDFVW
ncbi:hypothetical protein NDU88_001420 [Pleurodeles waltl]|uniref:Uncharacterized protein n=1 Tax=Pleurodeles waltl TaxID=8319 RepID=A0AAV7NK03_PLEWA|nr:hypothetical protein NDU88_001420 [Pleurodeles waltl]